MKEKTSVLFVCLGNICRSPTAHGIFQHRVDAANLGDCIYVDSAGTGDWHIGREPDYRAQYHAQQRGYDLSALRARQVSAEDFGQFDYILGMDKQNMHDLHAMCPADYPGHLSLFLDFLDTDLYEQGSDKSDGDKLGSDKEVPDPYYGGEAGFEKVLDMVETACDNLLNHIRSTRL